jgi:hypothetical protein
MSSRTLIILVVAAVVGAVSFLVARSLGHTLLFLPLFLFWSWGERLRPEVARDGCLAADRLSDTDGCSRSHGDTEEDVHRRPD